MSHKPDEFLTSEGNYRCPYCNRECSRLGICSHIWRVHEDGEDFKPALGHESWNKGKLKTNDERILKQGQTFHQRVVDGIIRPSFLGKTLTDSHRNSISATIKEKLNDGSWHVSSNHVKIHDYNGVKFHGLWEVAYAKWLDANDIKWRRPTESFPYQWNQKLHNYTPDFYLLEEKVYVEIKGREFERDRAKWSQFPHILRVLKCKELRELKII